MCTHMFAYVLTRDGSGPTNVVWSHIYLLIACALPLWVYSMLSECDSVIMHGTVVGINATTSENNLCTFVAPVLSRVYGSSAYRDMFHALFPHLGCLTVGIGDAMVRICFLYVVCSFLVEWYQQLNTCVSARRLVWAEVSVV